MSDILTKTIQISDKISLKIIKGSLANRADSSIELRFNDNVILSTLIIGKNRNNEYNFLPLHVDYQEKFYSIGRIPFGCKRESKLNDHEILISRLVDRCIRPCINKTIKNDIQLSINVLSANLEYKPENFACFSSSLCILLSSLEQFFQPVSEVFLYLIDDKWTLYPSHDIIKQSTGRIILGGTENTITMCEGDINGISKAKIIEGMQIGFEEIKKHCRLQNDFLNEYKNNYNQVISNNEVISENSSDLDDKYIIQFYNIFNEKIKNPNTRRDKILEIEKNINLNEAQNIDINLIKKQALYKLLKENNTRIDGRSTVEIRNIECKKDYLPCAHGSALFTRGYTQALVSVTLGDKNDESLIDEAYTFGYNKIILHYNFPSFCVGELSYSKSTSRREIGHGNLALKSLQHIIPKDNMFTIRIVSDILSSDGSSSMATVCGSCVALNDAGINTTEIISGIAMGLIFDKKDNNYFILSDICAEEDELGDLDLKLIGTKDKIFGLQMDVKCLSINIDIIEKIIEQGLIGLENIKNKILDQGDIKRNEPKDFAPHSKKIELDKNKILILCSNNLSNVQLLKKKYNCCITINDNTVSIVSKNKKCLDECIENMLNITTMPLIGDVFNGVVKKVQNNYSLIEFMNGKVGILKKEDVDWCRITDLTSILFAGDLISVKVMEIINNSKFILSHKILIENNSHDTQGKGENTQKENIINDTQEKTTVYHCENDYNIPDNI